MKILKLLFYILSYSFVEAKVLIITHAYNRPEFIELQDKTFKKFILDDYEFIVFNDARDKEIKKQIYQICEQLNIKCIRIPQKIHTKPYLYRDQGEDYNHPCCRCANVVQYSLNEIGFQHNDLVIIVDSDLFLIKEFNVRDYMKGYLLSGAEQIRGHIKYLWNGIVFLDMTNLPKKETINFNCGKVDGISTDVGGFLHYYIKEFSYIPIKYIDQWRTENFSENYETLIKNGLNQKTISFFDIKIPDAVFMLNSTFLHYQNGANWNGNSIEYHKKKFEKLKKFINFIVS